MGVNRLAKANGFNNLREAISKASANSAQTHQAQPKGHLARKLARVKAVSTSAPVKQNRDTLG